MLTQTSCGDPPRGPRRRRATATASSTGRSLKKTSTRWRSVRRWNAASSISGAPRRQPVHRQPPCKGHALARAQHRRAPLSGRRSTTVTVACQSARCVTRTQPRHLPAGDRVAKPRGGVRVPCLTHPLSEELRILTKKHIRTPVTAASRRPHDVRASGEPDPTHDVAPLRWRQLAMIRRERPDRLDDRLGPLVAETVKNLVAEKRSTLRP